MDNNNNDNANQAALAFWLMLSELISLIFLALNVTVIYFSISTTWLQRFTPRCSSTELLLGRRDAFGARRRAKEDKGATF